MLNRRGAPPPAPAGRMFFSEKAAQDVRDSRPPRAMPMQVTETSAAGLKREYRVVVPATDLEAKVNERLDDVKGRVQLRGFRPGKVPVEHLKRLYGKSAMAEVIEATVRDTNSKIITDHGYRLAFEPKVVLPTDEGEVERLIDGKSDLSYTVEMELVPAI